MPLDREAAVSHLRRCDPVMRRIVKQVGPLALRPGGRGDHFTTLLRAIVGQQLSGKAAETIWQRLIALHADGRRLVPADVLDMPEEVMRTAGLSRSKVAFAKDLAARIERGDLHLNRLGRRSDDDVIAELTAVHGIGRWTAEMFLIFKLGRPDVWPVDDLGVRNAVKRAYGIETSKDALAQVAEPWRPFRSAGTWYLWRSLDVEAL